MCAYVYIFIVTRQRLCKNIPVAMNTHATEEFLDASFFIRYLSQWKVCDKFFTELLVLYVVHYEHDDSNNAKQHVTLLTVGTPNISRFLVFLSP
jgi:hypothetical protein